MDSFLQQLRSNFVGPNSFVLFDVIPTGYWWCLGLSTVVAIVASSKMLAFKPEEEEEEEPG